jgi:hypothetical protein
MDAFVAGFYFRPPFRTRGLLPDNESARQQAFAIVVLLARMAATWPDTPCVCDQQMAIVFWKPPSRPRGVDGPKWVEVWVGMGIWVGGNHVGGAVLPIRIEGCPRKSLHIID